MITCKLTLYSECKIKPDKNFKVDDIEYYLANFCEPTVLAETYNYVKPQLKLDLNIKIDAYAELNFGYIGGDNEYLKIDYYDDDTKYATYYFFIENKTWKSDECISLSLYMDTINSLKDSVSITEKSTIHRQHKDRFMTYTSQGDTTRDIDIRSEGVYPMLYKKYEHTLVDDGRKYYLVYKNRDAINPTDFNQVNPVDTLIYTDKPFSTVCNYITESTIAPLSTWANIEYMSGDMNEGVFLYDITNKAYYELFDSPTMRSSIQLRAVPQWTLYYVVETLVNGVWTEQQKDFIDTQSFYFVSSSNDEIYITNIGTVPMTAGTSPVPLISTLDKTDSKLIKVIELPYAPFDYTMSNGVATLKKGTFNLITYGKGSLLLSTFDKYTKEITTDIYLGGSDFRLAYSPHRAGYQEARNDINESKLLHSDYYKYKIVYDSFSKEYPLENIDMTDYMSKWWLHTFKLQYIVSKNFTSRFMLKTDVKLKESLEDYDNILVVSRNNETPIYSSQYINYLRNGYNFDVKNKERQTDANNIRTAITATTAGIGVAGGILAGFSNPIIGAGAIVGAIASIGLSIMNSVNSEISYDNTIAQKIANARAQAVSVSTCDDVELLDEYTENNKVKVVIYKPSEHMQKVLADLFYYCGYKCEYQGIPDETSRIYFNYVSADIDCYGTNMPDDILEDFKNRYKIGLTVLHKAYDGQYYNYDFEQQYENWEVSML